MKLSIKEISTAISASAVYGNQDLEGEGIIIRSACTAAMKNSVFFDLRKFKDPEKPIERMYGLGVRIFVVKTLPENYETEFQGAAFLIVDNIPRAVNAYILKVFSMFKGRVITVPDRENSCAVKDWMYTLLKPDYKVFTTLRYVSELDFLENVSLLSDDFQAAILQIPDRYEFTSIGELEKLDDVIFEEDEFSYTSKIKEKNTDITLEYRDKKFTVTIPFCDNIHAEDAVHCLCYLVKSGLYKESHKKVFETLSLPDDQIKMRDAEFNMGLISCFSSVNNLYSISKTFDFLARQHQFEGRCAVIKNPDFENLSAEEFFEGLF
ncbi:MAG: hypothetical protein VZQ51_06960, partial [Bacteroidales bacterium]|nr:hypothetical protein [Bacteroidales bacterium]